MVTFGMTCSVFLYVSVRGGGFKGFKKRYLPTMGEFGLQMKNTISDV